MRYLVSLSVVLSLLLSARVLSAQDLIINREGSKVEAYVEEISHSEGYVRYRRYDNPTGPVYKISIATIARIEYENGMVEQFSVDPGPLQVPEEKEDLFARSPSRIHEGMRYKELKSLYNRRDYAKLEDPYYGTGRSWMNLLVPGLAQYTMGESGLGTRYLLLGSVAPLVLTTSGYALAAGAGEDIGIILAMAGVAMSLTFGIISISNAQRVAKVKSLYYHDLGLKQSQPYSLQFSPTLIPTIQSSQVSFAPGVGMRVTF